jgi:hypothetical protein
VLLSVAAYFFIIGRYGIKVGDRITIASVTGDVVDVGLIRFYLMELAGTGTSLNPTGRIAVFSNAVLFQAGTPLYKQIPGTEYAWHELIVKLADASDYSKCTQSTMDIAHRSKSSTRARRTRCKPQSILRLLNRGCSSLRDHFSFGRAFRWKSSTHRIPMKQSFARCLN